MSNNINAERYWEQRFSSGNWQARGGRLQTLSFARGIIPYLEIAKNFTGTILDFGCGLGDAIPVYKENFPKANLMGVDISSSAIELCQMKYGPMAIFLQGDYRIVPYADVIVTTVVFEHLSDDVSGWRGGFSRGVKTCILLFPTRNGLCVLSM